MMRYVTGVLFVLICSAPYVMMLGTGGDESIPSRSGQEILAVVSPHRREVRLEYNRGFRQWMKSNHNRDVRIQWLDVGGTSKILKDLESRFSKNPEAIGVDIFFGGGVGAYFTAIEQGWLTPTPLSDDVLKTIPARCAGAPVYDTEKRWFGVALSGFGIIYNRPLIERLNLPTPQSWEDLGRPEYFTWLASGDPRSSGSVHMCYEIILQAYGFEKGWDLITRICANVRNFGEGGGVAPREVAAGEVVAGMVIDQYAQTVIDAVGSEALGFVLPEGATVVNADPIARLKGGPKPDLAERFIQYVLTDEGQRLLYVPAGVGGQRFSLHRMPVKASLYEKPDAPEARPYDMKGDFDYDTRKGSRRWRMVNDLIGVWLIDAHTDLTRAWEAVIRAGSDPGLVREMSAPPLTEKEAEALQEKWKDSRERLRVMTSWANLAQARYREIERRASATFASAAKETGPDAGVR